MSALLPFTSAAPPFADALPIEQAEILGYEGHFFARVRSGEWHGVAALTHWTPTLISLWQTVVLPFWIGRDARYLTDDLDAIADLERNYKLSGAPFWMAVAGIELALWDLLGTARGHSVAEMIAPKPRRKIPVYLSSSRRDTDIVAEIETLSEAIETTGARAAKVKIGGRLKWDEQTEARDRKLLKLARQKWGGKFVIYADANGSFEAEKAIEVGQLLHEHKVAWFEEPCYWEDFEATRTVASSVQLPVAGGGQDSSPPKWRWLLENCALDIAQPDLHSNGGLVRALWVAQFAAQLDVMTTPHSPYNGPQMLPALHFAAAIGKPAPFLEWPARALPTPGWATPLEVVKGALTLPKGAGWGANYDDEIWKRAEILAAASV